MKGSLIVEDMVSQSMLDVVFCGLRSPGGRQVFLHTGGMNAFQATLDWFILSVGEFRANGEISYMHPLIAMLIDSNGEVQHDVHRFGVIVDNGESYHA